MQRSVDHLSLETQRGRHLLDLSPARQTLSDARHADFELFKVLRAHILPLTYCAFNKNGDAFVTGSYDRTCKVWDTASGEETHTLEGHKNVVYAVAFNNPFGDKVITGSFDKTCKLWDARTGELFCSAARPRKPGDCVPRLDPSSTAIATGSMDASARLWDVETGRETCALRGHTAEIVSLSFSTSGNTLLTGSFDHDCRLWDARVGSSACAFWRATAPRSARRASTCVGRGGERVHGPRRAPVGPGERQGDVRLAGPLGRGPGRVLRTRPGARWPAPAAASTARVYGGGVGRVRARGAGHRGEISKVSFDPRGARVLTASSDATCKLWDASGDVRADPGGAHGRDIFVRVQLPGGQDHHREQGQARAGYGRASEGTREACRVFIYQRRRERTTRAHDSWRVTTFVT